jgi:hypothetical protein
MKSVLAFVTVCCLSAAAPAALQLTVNGVATNRVSVMYSDTMMIGIQNDAGDDQYNAALILTCMGEWTGYSRLNRPLPMAQGWEYFGPTEGIGDIWFAWFAQPVTDKLPAGIMGEVGFRLRHFGDAQIVLTDDSLDQLDFLMITAPEPATLALLGLGAMMIRRKQSA